MSGTDNNPTSPTSNVREPHQHTDGLPTATPTTADLNAATDPKSAVPAPDPQN